MEFLIEKSCNISISYETLLHRINNDEYIIHNYFLNDIGEYFINVIKTIINNYNLKLLDLDLSLYELQDILKNEQANIRFNLPKKNKINNLEELRERIINSKSKVTLFTSGTTGTPKAIQHNISNILRGVVINDKHRNDKWAFLYNPTHIGGLQLFFQIVLNFNEMHYLYNKDKEYLIQQIFENKITHISATPTLFKLILPLHNKNTFVQRITLGGEPSTTDLIKRIHENFPQAKITNIYATTETGTLFISHGDFFEVPEKIKQFIRINNNILEIHKILLGEMNINTLNEWYSSGDVVEILNTEPLYFRILGRETDEVKVAGNRVNLAEVENVLNSHHQVVACKVFTKKNSITGIILCADVVVSDDNINESDLIRFMSEKLQPFKVPRVIKKVKNLELTRTGKLKRTN